MKNKSSINKDLKLIQEALPNDFIHKASITEAIKVYGNKHGIITGIAIKIVESYGYMLNSIAIDNGKVRALFIKRG